MAEDDAVKRLIVLGALPVRHTVRDNLGVFDPSVASFIDIKDDSPLAMFRVEGRHYVGILPDRQGAELDSLNDTRAGRKLGKRISAAIAALDS